MQYIETPASVTLPGFEMPAIVANPINAIALPIFAFLALLITYLPLRSFYRVKNVAACSIMSVIIIVNLETFINALIWPDDDFRKWWRGYGLCDIEVTVRYPITMALATSLCCLSKGLADALDTEHAVFNPSKRHRRRRVILDVLFCWFVPVMQMVLHYTVQAGRYAIFPVIGCADQLDNSWPTLAIFIVWCPAFLLFNVYYAALMLIRLYRHRRTISAALTSTGSGLAPRKFIKLVLISLLLIIIYLPIQTLFVFYSIPQTLVPYSWSRIHNPATWSPILFVHTAEQPSLQWYGWAGVAMSCAMFTFFGFNDDAVESYRCVLVWCGVGRVWPGLKMSREERRDETLVGSMGSRGSFKSQFDLVGKAMKYFDAGSRKDSVATGATLMDGSTTTSRKASNATFTKSNNSTSLFHIPTSTTTITSSPTHHGTPPHISTFDFTHSRHQQDEISFAPSFPSPHTPSSSAKTTTTPLHTGIHRSHGSAFSLFRTHVQLPFNIFTSSSKTSKSASPSIQRAEEEAELYTIHNPSSSTAGTSAGTGTCTVKPTFSPHSYTHSKSCSGGDGDGDVDADIENKHDDNDERDAHSPKLGTRAYRERERRELALSSPSTSTKNTGISRVLADEVQQDIGSHILPLPLPLPLPLRQGSGGKGKGSNDMGGVVVTRSLEVREERA